MAAKIDVARPSDVLVSRHSDVCSTLSVSETTLESLTGKLFQLRIVDRSTKTAVMSKAGYKGADTLLDYVEMRVDNNPEILQSVFEAMSECESLKEIVHQMKRKWESETKHLSTGINIIYLLGSVCWKCSIVNTWVWHLQTCVAEIVS